MTSRPSKFGRRVPRTPRQCVRAPVTASQDRVAGTGSREFVRTRMTALVLALVCGGGPAVPVGAADEATATPAASDEQVLGRAAIIGKLIPITGDPIEVRSLDLRVEFRINSAELAEGAVAQLRELGAALVSEALTGAAVGVYGHTDTSGGAEYNQALSERRARAVAGFLREHFGIADVRFREVRGFGEERLRDDLPPDAPGQRRVEIVSFHETGGNGAPGGVGTDTPQPPAHPPEAAVAGEAARDGVVVRLPQTEGVPDGTREEEPARDGEESGYIAIH